MATGPRILFATAEAFPFAGTGGLGEVGRSLPKALKALGVRVTVALPFYRVVKEGGWGPRPVAEFGVRVGGREVPTRVLSLDRDGVTYLFFDQPEFFDRPHLYGPPGEGYPDNAQRFASFTRALVRFGELMGWPFDLLHANDWHTALLPLYLPPGRPPVLLTIHNLGYQGDFPAEVLGDLGLQGKEELLLHHGRVNFLKAGILAADLLTTVSPTYAQEIQTPEYGFGLDPYLRERSGELLGILNGVDYSLWDPRHDPYIPCPYGPDDLGGKGRCKEALLRELGLPPSVRDRPLFGMVGRLAQQKGLDLLLPVLGRLAEGHPVVILGVGEGRYEEALRELARRHPLLRPIFSFDEPLSHRITAGADIYLMPSLYEPCGLNQMYALRYGTVPVVRDTGGLRDTVRQVDPSSGTGTGFKFRGRRPCFLWRAIRRAMEAYRREDLWRRIQRQGMAEDFSWERSAEGYLEAYRRLLSPR